MDTLAGARRRVGEAASEADRLAALIELGSALYEFDAAEAVAVSEEAIGLALSLGDSGSRAWAQLNRAWALAALGRTDEALEEHLAVLDLFELDGDVRGVAHALMAIGDLHRDAGDVLLGLEYLDRAAAPMEEAGDQLGQAVVMNLTGLALSQTERHRQAADMFHQAESMFAALDDPLRVTMSKVNRGFELMEIAGSSGTDADLVEAARCLANETISAAALLGDGGRSTMAYGRWLLSHVYAAGGEGGQALTESELAQQDARLGGFDVLAADIGLDRTGWLIEAGLLSAAADSLDDIKVIATKSDNLRCLSRVCELRAGLLDALGDPQGALAAYREFHRLDRQVRNEAAERRAQLTAAQFQVERARREARLAQLRVAELEALDHDKREFLASVSHELRTPLAAVLGFATELADAWDGFQPEEARSMVRLIARQSADISSIVEDLLTITRLEAGTMSVYPTTLDVAEHLGDFVESLGRESGRELALVGKATVWADPIRLRQIVRNLISNAFRYGGDSVRVLVLNGESSARLEVRDSGGPIQEARAQTIFEPFVRADDGARTPNSVGLGLAIARSLARMMEGDLTYSYEDGESVFRLELKAVTAH